MTALNSATASHLPTTSSNGRAGVISSGSSDCRSRSPAVSVERRRHAAHDGREQPVVRDEEQQERARLLRRGEVDGVDVERIADVGRHAAQQQALRAPLPVVRAQQRLGLAIDGLRAVARAVVDEPNGAGLAFAPRRSRTGRRSTSTTSSSPPRIFAS